jgi:hypothetical protein
VKGACEILDEATLTARFEFNNQSLVVDAGPNAIVANTSSYLIEPAGHSLEAIGFIGSTSSYFQASGITLFGLNSTAFSISLWIRLQSLTGVIHCKKNTFIDLL